MRLAGNARPRPERSKVANARRMVQLLEFFDACREESTVNVIAAHHGWPQSSTSDLLSVLVECGLLYRDPDSGAFAPTPRAAMLAAQVQPPMLREGRLAGLMEHLADTTGLGVALIGKVGRHAQMFGWNEGGRPPPVGRSAPAGGGKSPLHESAAGWLLLSTLEPSRVRSVLHRLRGEAPPERTFHPTAIAAQVQTCAQVGHVVGPAGFDTPLSFCGVLAPGTPAEQPLAIGFMFDKAQVAPATLTAVLQRAVGDWLRSDAAPAGDGARCAA